MAKMVPVKNSTAMIMHLGGVMIPPGETRAIPEHHVPAHLRPEAVNVPAAVESPDEALLEILDHSIPEIVEMLPALSDDELTALQAAEQAGKTRNGLMKAFEEERLRRADRQVELDNYTGQLQALDVEALQTEREAVADDAEKAAIVDALISERSGGE